MRFLILVSCLALAALLPGISAAEDLPSPVFEQQLPVPAYFTFDFCNSCGRFAVSPDTSLWMLPEQGPRDNYGPQQLFLQRLRGHARYVTKHRLGHCCWGLELRACL